MDKKKCLYGVITAILVVAFVACKQLDIMDNLIPEQKEIRPTTPCEYMDLTPNGYEDNKLVQNCLDSISAN
jgi:hypothetical protein